MSRVYVRVVSTTVYYIGIPLLQPLDSLAWPLEWTHLRLSDGLLVDQLVD